MRYIILLYSLGLAMGISSCKDALPSSVTIHDTLYQHYWDPEQSGVSSTLIAVRFSSLKKGTAVGAGGVVVNTTDGGEIWNTGNSGTGSDLYGLSLGSANTGIAVGSSGTVIRTTDGGANWEPLSVDIDVQFRNVQMLGAGMAYVIGSRYFGVDNTKGYIYKTTDAGLTWNQLTIDAAAGLYGISFTDPQNGWVSGLQGAIYKTTDGGVSWTKQISNVDAAQQVTQIFFTDANHGIAVGTQGIAGNPAVPTTGFILRTSDGGTTWTKLSATPLSGLWVPDQLHAVAVGYSGTVMETADGGATWTTNHLNSMRLLNVFMNDQNNGALVGENGKVYMLGPH